MSLAQFLPDAITIDVDVDVSVEIDDDVDIFAAALEGYINDKLAQHTHHSGDQLDLDGCQG